MFARAIEYMNSSLVFFFCELSGKIIDGFTRNERIHYFRKKHQKLHKGQHFFGFQLARTAPVLCRAGGEPSTWFPLGTRRADNFPESPFFIFFPTWSAIRIQNSWIDIS